MTLYNNAAVTDLISFISKLMLSKCIKQWCETSPYCLTICLSNDWDCKVLFHVFRVVGVHVIVVLSVLSFEIFLLYLLYEISIGWSIVVLFVCFLFSMTFVRHLFYQSGLSIVVLRESSDWCSVQWHGTACLIPARTSQENQRHLPVRDHKRQENSS